MIPVVTVAEMTEIDAAAPEPVDVLIARAGSAVAQVARRMLGGLYGKRIVVVAGGGNNGADGRVAAERLARRGAHVEIVAPVVGVLPHVDLVIDAAFGTGLSRPYEAPTVSGSPMVLAVDIPSGLTGDNGTRLGTPMMATRTVTFEALKPGHLLGDGPEWCGEIDVAPIGLDVSAARMHLMETADANGLVPRRPRDAHKWQTAVLTVAGSIPMPGAARLSCRAALRTGAGYVARVGLDGSIDHGIDDECVQLDHFPEPSTLNRFSAGVIGPGLGLSPAVGEEVRERCAELPMPLVVDADALHHLAEIPASVKARSHQTVMTPHAGEFSALSSEDGDRVDAVRDVAASFGAVVLSKGPTTIISDPAGTVRFVDVGDERLATAGTGDVLSGMIGGLLARGADAFDAATGGALLHGMAARHGPREGLIASDVAAAIPAALADARSMSLEDT